MVLIHQGEMEKVEESLIETRSDKACAYYLAREYLRHGEVEEAVRWINFARLFVNQGRDQALFPSILFYMLLLDPDSSKAAKLYPAPAAYDSERDYDALLGYGRGTLQTLGAEVDVKLLPEVALFLRNPKEEKCPEKSIWMDRLYIEWASVKSICHDLDEPVVLEDSIDERESEVIDGPSRTLMAEVDEKLSAGVLPGRDVVESWNDFKKGVKLRAEYSTAIELWNLWSMCWYSENRCLETLCHSDPCLKFVNDDRTISQNYVGKPQLQELREYADAATRRKTLAYIANIDAFFGGEEPSNSDPSVAITMSGALELLKRDYRSYADQARVRVLEVKAEADILIAQAPSTPLNAEPEWLNRLRSSRRIKQPDPSYAVAISILDSYDRCVRSVGSPLAPEDPCLDVVARWQSTGRIRRRNQLKKYSEGAKRILREKEIRRSEGVVNVDEGALRLHEFYDQTSTELDSLGRKLERIIPFFGVALSAWRGEVVGAGSRAEELLIAAISHLKNFEFTNATERESLEARFSEFQREAFEESVSSENRACIVFIRKYFAALRYLEKGEPERTLQVLRDIEGRQQLPQEALEAVKRVEEATAFLVWASSR